MQMILIELKTFREITYFKEISPFSNNDFKSLLLHTALEVFCFWKMIDWLWFNAVQWFLALLAKGQKSLCRGVVSVVCASVNNCLWSRYSLQFWLYLNQTYTVVRYLWELCSFCKPARSAHARLDYGPWNCQNCYNRPCEHNRGSIYYLIFTKLTQ